VVDRVVAARPRRAGQLRGGGHHPVAAGGHAITRLIRVGEANVAVEGAAALLRRSLAEGPSYDEAGYDQAMALWLHGRALLHAGRAEEALGPLAEAEIRFFALASEEHEGAERMASVVLAEQGDALRHLGRLDEAATTLRRAIAMDDARGDRRQLAHVRVSLGIVRARQGQLGDALETFQRARELFDEMDDPVATANCWHQMGTVYVQGGAADRAERAFQQALRLRARAEDRGGEAVTLVQLGNLYRETGRTEEAVGFFAQAADILHELGDAFREAAARNNLAEAFHALGRLAEAREQVRLALERGADAGVAAHPWKSWDLLAAVERDAGDAGAADAADDRARETYLEYRRGGGEPLDGATRLVADIGAVLSARGGDAAEASLPPAEAFGDGAAVLRDALVALVRGERDISRMGVVAFPYSLRAEFELILAR
jgi:tetratricopeptide (TPR) repeat protein